MAAPVGTKAATRGTKPVARAQPIYTEEKAVHLVNVFIAILSFMILIGWLEIMLLTPLRLEKIEMVSAYLVLLNSSSSCHNGSDTICSFATWNDTTMLNRHTWTLRRLLLSHFPCKNYLSLLFSPLLL